VPKDAATHPTHASSEFVARGEQRFRVTQYCDGRAQRPEICLDYFGGKRLVSQPCVGTSFRVETQCASQQNQEGAQHPNMVQL